MPLRLKPSILTRQDHIRHVDESDIEYYTPTDSDEILGGFGFKVDGDSDTDEEDATGTSDNSEDDSSDAELDENENIIPKKKKKKKTLKTKDGRSLTPPMSPKSKTRYRCIKGELLAARAKTEAIRAKHASVKYVLESQDADGQAVLNDEISSIVALSQRNSDEIDANLRVSTDLFAKTNGLSGLPVCTCNEAPMTRIGSNEKGSLAAYCQIHMPFAAAKMGKYGTSHSEREVEEATRRLRVVYLEEKAQEMKRKEKLLKAEAKRKEKLLKAEAKRRQIGNGSNRGAGNSQQRTIQGSNSDSDWDLSNVAKTCGGGGGPPLVVPNPHIERSKERLAGLRQAHGYQLFETRSHYMIVTNNTSKSLYRMAKIERFSDEFRIDEDPHLYSQLQMKNLLQMSAMSQQGCKRVSSGHGIIGFIQLYNFESTSETGMDLDAMNESNRHGDIIKMTEEIYRKHVWAMKRKELMFSFLERTKTVRGIPSYLYQLGPYQGYTLFSGADVVRPIGKFGKSIGTRGIPSSFHLSKFGRRNTVDGVALSNAQDEDEPTDKAQQGTWFTSLLRNIDRAVEQQEEEEKRQLAMKMKNHVTEDDERIMRERERLAAEEEAARAAAEMDWTKLILEGFIVPEIPTDNALPGQITKVANNKFIYRTKYLTIFRDLEPSDDEDSEPETALLDAPEQDSSSSETEEELVEENPKGEKGKKKAKKKKGQKGALDTETKTIGQSANETSTVSGAKKSTGTAIDDETASKPLLSMPSKMSDAVVKAAEDKTEKKFVSSLTRLKSSTERSDVAAVTPSALAKGPELPSSKPTQTQRENAVVINTKTYPEENVYETDSDPDYSDDAYTSLDSDESSDTDDDKEFVEYTLIERILIFLGFLEDHQAKRDDDSSDSDDEYGGGGFFTRAYGGATAAVKTVTSAATSAARAVTRTGTSATASKPETTASKKLKSLSKRKGETKGYKKKKSAEPKARLTAEELKEKIERRKKALEAQKERRARRAAIREARAKAREKAERRINRYKFDPAQDIVKLRFKAFGNHARVVM